MSTSYDTWDLPYDQRANLLRRAFAVSFYWWADKLDCSESLQRQRIESSIEEAMNRFAPDSHFFVCGRFTPPENHYEFGYRTGTGDVDYFLWVQVTPENAIPLLEGLKQQTYS